MNVAQALIGYAESNGKRILPVIEALAAEHARKRDSTLPGRKQNAHHPTFAASTSVPSGLVPPGPSAGKRQRAVYAASTQLGKPYVFGSGPDTSSFDCSDLVQWAYKQVGVNIPRDTYGQMKVLRPKSWAGLQVGDPIYRKNGGHVVLYAGHGQVLAAPHTGTDVQYQPLSDFTRGDYEPYQAPGGGNP